jgi:hypothetical protein
MVSCAAIHSSNQLSTGDKWLIDLPLFVFCMLIAGLMWPRDGGSPEQMD